eukprot:EC097394.1.p2 GENE.EC097394.1~~EC097394.1.p2  ORF type:complete len:114 (-),score=1.01 EC097394.1:64-405(-)
MIVNMTRSRINQVSSYIDFCIVQQSNNNQTITFLNVNNYIIKNVNLKTNYFTKSKLYKYRLYIIFVHHWKNLILLQNFTILLGFRLQGKKSVFKKYSNQTMKIMVVNEILIIS